MHEVSIVQALIENIDSQLAAQNVRRVSSVRVRRGSTFSADALEQAFSALVPGTRLEGAALLVETFDTRFTCADCGHSQTITSDDLTGHFFLCPSCDALQEIDEAHDLELLEVRAEE
ncbi:MAG: hydrogenase maturation nickel metallochaperone HypA [Caldilineaceae bacterium]|nr:hydrogenase maturation nickel metallochaperone HypA [Caldilineaceae bacterium]